MNYSTWLERLRAKLGFSAADIDEDFLDGYAKLLIGQYASLPVQVESTPPPSDAEKERRRVTDGARREAEDVVQKVRQDQDYDWEDLYRLELAIIKLEPAEHLVRRAWILRNEFHELASVQEVKDYEASHYPDPYKDKSVSTDLLRADLVKLQEELNWRYSSLWVLEQYRAKLALGVVVASLLFAVIFAGAAYGIGHRWNLVGHMLSLIAIAGVIGGMASTLRRLQHAELDGNTDLELAGLDHGNLGIFLSPALGGIFALILFFIFCGRMISGPLFPEVTLREIGVAGGDATAASVEIAKLIVWSFLAGFAERLVPDRLEKLSGEATKATSVKEHIAKKMKK